MSVFTVPDGSGTPLTSALMWDGVPGSAPQVVDATIHMTLLAFGDPVNNFPAEDMFLFTSLGGLVLCPGGSIADSDTDLNGYTSWSQAIGGGGATDPDAGEVTQIWVGGMICPDVALQMKIHGTMYNYFAY